MQSVAQRWWSVVRRGDAVERFAERCTMCEQWYSGWCGVPDGVASEWVSIGIVRECLKAFAVLYG